MVLLLLNPSPFATPLSGNSLFSIIINFIGYRDRNQIILALTRNDFLLVLISYTAVIAKKSMRVGKKQ